MAGEALKFVADGLEGFVVVEVLFIDVEDDGVLGMELAQRAIAFIGLDDEPAILSGDGEGVRSRAGTAADQQRFTRSAAAEARVAGQLRHGRTDGEARLGLQFLEGKREQRGGRGLAVHAGDADAALASHECGEQAGAARDGELELLRGENLGVFEADGGGINHEERRRVAKVRGGVSDRDARTAATEDFHVLVFAEVRAADAKTEIEQQMAEAAHAAAARADEMHGAAGRCLAKDGADLAGVDAGHARLGKKLKG